MKHTMWLIFLVPAALMLCAPLFAQSGEGGEGEISSSRIANVKVWVAPVSGGTAAEREYFDFNMPEEVRGSGYELAESKEDSDFYILFTLEHDEEYDDEMITAELYTTKTNALIITNSMGYKAVEDMSDWNLTLIYQLMANAPLHKYINTIDRTVQTTPPKPVLGFPEYRLYLGLRGGYSNRQYQILADEALRIDRGLSRGHSFEAGIQVSFQPLRFLAIQAEVMFTNDAAPIKYVNMGEEGLTMPTETYDTFSMLVPLTLKGTFHLYERLALNPFAGVYYIQPLGKLSGMQTDAAGEVVRVDSDYAYSLPLGWTAGFEVGMVLGKERNRGTIFMDLRYSADLGNLVRSDGMEVYKRTAMVSITAGYRYGFLKRNKQSPVKEDLPEDFDLGL